jgi:hypothetical protein
MSEVCTQAITIQRVIGGRYPNTRLFWQNFQQHGATRPYLYSPSPPEPFERSAPVTVTRSWEPPPTADPRDTLDPRYPETRLTRIRATGETVGLQTGAARSGSRPPSGLPSLAASDDPRRWPAPSRLLS